MTHLILVLSLMVGEAALAARSTVRCTSEKIQLYNRLERCLTLQGKESRRACFFGVGQKISDSFLSQCQSIVELARAETQDEELTRYPQQGSALNELESETGITYAFGRQSTPIL